MLENREIMMRMFPDLFQKNRVAPIEDYPEILRRTLLSVAPAKCDGEPKIAVLTRRRSATSRVRAVKTHAALSLFIFSTATFVMGVGIGIFMKNTEKIGVYISPI